MKHAIVLLSALLLISACGGEKEMPQAAELAAEMTCQAGGPDTCIALIDDEPITDEDIRKVVGAKLTQAEMDLYDARKEGIDLIINDRLLEAEAKKAGITKDQLVKDAVNDKIKVEDKEIEKFYNENKSQMQGKPLEEVRESIRGFLVREKSQKLYGELTDRLRKTAKIEIHIKPVKREISEGDSPAIGPKDAPVTIVEFTDYQCPFCGRARPTIDRVLKEYKGKVRYVLRDFPLSFHKEAQKAHETAHCAGEQGKYWEMNKKLFGNQQAIKIDDLKKYAQELKLNTNKFNECLDSGKYAEKIRKSQEDGSIVGVSGTPAFFINGRMISGARPFEAFKEIIDDELESGRR